MSPEDSAVGSAIIDEIYKIMATEVISISLKKSAIEKLKCVLKLV